MYLESRVVQIDGSYIATVWKSSLMVLQIIGTAQIKHLRHM